MFCHTRLCLSRVCTCLCTDLYKTFLIVLYYHMSLNFKFHKDLVKIMGRYTQNNKDICLIINFQCILHIFTNMDLQSLQMIMDFLETRYQNGQGFGRRWHHFKLTGCLLFCVGTPYFAKIINEHTPCIVIYIAIVKNPNS